MISNDLAKQFYARGLSGEYLSANQGNWLFDLAHKEGRTDSRGQRIAVGEFDGKSWRLVRDQSRWLFLVQGRNEKVSDQQKEGAYISREISHPMPSDFWKNAGIPESLFEGGNLPIPICSECGTPLDDDGTCPACKEGK